LAIEYINNKSFEKEIVNFQEKTCEKKMYEFIIEDYHNTYNRNFLKNNNITKPEILLNYEKKYQETTEFHNASKELLAESFMILAERLARTYTNNATGVSIEDAMQEAVMVCFEKVGKFNPKSGKAFNYLTTCIINHFRQIFRTNNTFIKLKKKYLCYLQEQIETIFYRNGKIKTNFSQD
jgi:DNA-directed RNA polymerase sigma subunit (sigma70/sigma32)